MPGALVRVEDGLESRSLAKSVQKPPLGTKYSPNTPQSIHLCQILLQVESLCSGHEGCDCEYVPDRVELGTLLRPFGLMSRACASEKTLDDRRRVERAVRPCALQGFLEGRDPEKVAAAPAGRA